jgi:hypothetical protein
MHDFHRDAASGGEFTQKEIKNISKIKALIVVSASRRIFKVGWLPMAATFNLQNRIVNTEIVPVPLSMLRIKWPKQ